MVCEQCNEGLPEDSRFCLKCGAKVSLSSDHQSDLIEEVDTSEQVDGKQETSPLLVDREEVELSGHRHGKSRILSLLPIFVPMISLLIVGGGVSAYYTYETNTNKDVLTLQQSAEAAALEGEYEQAHAELTKALQLRPGYAVLSDDLEVVKRAQEYILKLERVSEHIKEQEFPEAKTILMEINEHLTQESDPVFSPLPEQVAEKEVTVTVGEIKQELDALTSLSDLVDKLTIVASLPKEEAGAVKDQIITKIVQVTTEQAEQQLQKKQFSDALKTVNHGLEYATGNERLDSFKERIQKEQDAFERAEQERLEQAMEAAAKEDLVNRTAAVQVDTFETYVDDYGDLYVYGEVTNVATKDIYSITIYYSLYDLDGTYLYSNSTTVYPNYLARNEQGAFDDVIYNVYQDVKVEIDNMTWYLE